MISSENLVGLVLSRMVTHEQYLFCNLRMFHDLTSLHACYAMDICQLYLTLTHLLLHMLCLTSKFQF